MIKEIQFKNFKVLRDTTLPLGRFTLIVGPNGSGKSTALEALKAARSPQKFRFDQVVSIGAEAEASLKLKWDRSAANQWAEIHWRKGRKAGHALQRAPDGAQVQHQGIPGELQNWLSAIRVYDFHPPMIARAVQLQPRIELNPDGGGLAGVLDRLRDEEPERFEALNAELNRWLPEYNHILFEVPDGGKRAFALRTVDGVKIAAQQLSNGTLLALAILTLAYLPDPAPLVAFEDPDRGLHPRLLRDVQDALYRLAYPENFGEQREPVQVIATTHSPYFLDLFREHPEEIVIAEKRGSEAVFHRLADRPDIEDILQDASLGEVWYSGVLGGVPAEP